MTGAAPTEGPGLTVVVMAYNEAETVSGVLAELLSALEGLGRPHELLIVDDGSTDGTAAAVDGFSAAHPAARVVRHAENRGLGGVYRTGFAEARGTLLTFFPADGQFPASILADFFPVARNADLVLGYLPDRRDTPIGRTLSAVERGLYRMLVGPMPRFQGVFMLRRSVLDGLALASTGRGWGVVMEMILRVSRSGARVVSRPTPYRPRLAGVSKVNNWRTIAANLQQLFALRAILSAGHPK
ncbi:MAG: glycosyltransferase family 2 protein [Gemmatimonadales bacterium]